MALLKSNYMLILNSIIQVKIEKIEDISKAVVKIWEHSPHAWKDKDVIAEIENGINEIRKIVVDSDF